MFLSRRCDAYDDTPADQLLVATSTKRISDMLILTRQFGSALGLLVLVPILTTGCGVNTRATLLSTNQYPAVQTDSVRVFLSAEDLPPDFKYEDLAFITAEAQSAGDDVFNLAVDETDIVRALRERAGKLGANALILRGAGRIHPGQPYEGQAKAIRLLSTPTTGKPRVGEVWEDLLEGRRVLIRQVDTCAVLCERHVEGATCISYGSDTEEEGCQPIDTFLLRFIHAF